MKIKVGVLLLALLSGCDNSPEPEKKVSPASAIRPRHLSRWCPGESSIFR